MIKYEWWAHRRTGQTFAIRLEDGAVTGACGALFDTHMLGEVPSGLAYDACSMATFRARQCPEEFVLAEPFFRGHPVPVQAAARRGLIQEIMERLPLAAAVDGR